MRKVAAVAVKELRQAARDPMRLTMLLLVPAFMLLLNGYALNFDVEHLRLGVVDRDLTAQSRALIDAFTGSGRFDLVRTYTAADDLARALRRCEVKAILVIPERFGRDQLAGHGPAVQLLLDGTDSNTATNALGYAETVVLAAGAQIASGKSGVPVRANVWFNPELKSSHFLIPGLIGMILMLTAVLSTAMSIVKEKELGTYEQLKTTPLAPAELIFGKTVPYLLISVAATVVVLVAARLLFGVEIRGSLPALSAVTLLYLFGALGFGLLISSLFSSQAAAFQVGSVVSLLPAIFLSGFVFPLQAMPWPLQAVSYAVPARYFMVVLRGIMLKGTGLGPFGKEVALLAVYALLMVAVAWVRLTREDSRR